MIGGLILATFAGPDGGAGSSVNLPIGRSPWPWPPGCCRPRAAPGVASTWIWSGRCCSAPASCPCCCPWSTPPTAAWPALAAVRPGRLAAGRHLVGPGRRGGVVGRCWNRSWPISGYAPGLAIGSLYFLGFTGIWLVLALFFQDGLGYSPLRSGLAVTPFALGVAASAVVAGRLVGRVGAG